MKIEASRLAPKLVGEIKMRQFIALIHRDEGSDFGVSFPDLPGVISAGSNLDEARLMAEEALALHLEGLAEDGEAVPEPSSLEEIMAIAENRGAVAVLVDAPPSEVKTVRVNVTLPADTLAAIECREPWLYTVRFSGAGSQKGHRGLIGLARSASRCKTCCRTMPFVGN